MVAFVDAIELSDASSYYFTTYWILWVSLNLMTLSTKENTCRITIRHEHYSLCIFLCMNWNIMNTTALPRTDMRCYMFKVTITYNMHKCYECTTGMVDGRRLQVFVAGFGI